MGTAREIAIRAGNAGCTRPLFFVAITRHPSSSPRGSERAHLLLRRNARDFLRFQLFRLLGLAIAVPVTSGQISFHDGQVPINTTPTVDDNSAAAANKQRWRLPGSGRD